MSANDGNDYHGLRNAVADVVEIAAADESFLELDEVALATGSALAARFENWEAGEAQDATEMRAVRDAFLRRAESERHLAEAVGAARAARHSWATIGTMVGTSGEAARQRYGDAVKKT